jgi:ribosomal protein S18 acetylase RimI-like enzyme
MSLEIISYKAELARYFYDFNIVWLEKFFYVEPFDREVLQYPEKYIISPGGHIFFAIEDKEVVGTVAMLKHKHRVFEITKMAVPPIHQGKRIGQKLLEHCIRFGEQNNFEKIILYSHTKLENAIYIYKKFGFKEIELEKDNPYDRSDIKMQLPIACS